MATPLIIAHRGASAEAPENTLPAFRRAIARGADGIELDVQLSCDGVPVVFHDDSLRRLTGQPGRVRNKTWMELQKYRVLEGRAGIPRLVDVLAFTRRRIVVQIELKRGASVTSVITAVKKARAEEWVILASFELPLMCEAANLAPAIPRMLISEGQRSLAGLIRQLEACSAQGMSVDYRSVRNAGHVASLQIRGFVVWCWTVNSPVVARRLMKWGIDGLLGDNPALLKRLV